MAKRNYREIYEGVFGPIQEGNHIHHLDHDRKNNSIENLVSIPAKTHQRYHFFKHTFERHFEIKEMDQVSEAEVEMMKKFLDCYYEIINKKNMQGMELYYKGVI